MPDTSPATLPDTSGKPRIIYIHGFNSSPDSEKAQEFFQYFSSQFPHASPEVELHMPALSSDPEQAIVLLESLIAEAGGCFLVGSSLGGYYATYLAEKYHLKAALINPAVSPVKNLGSEFLGRHTNYYTGEEYELTMDHVDYLSTLDREVLQYPELYLLLVQTGDKVLDYRLALERYAGSRQVVQEGGDHSFVNFEAVLPEIFQFFGLKI